MACWGAGKTFRKGARPNEAGINETLKSGVPESCDFSRGEVQILVEFSKPIGWEFISLKEYLEGVLEREVDLVTAGALKPQMKEQILKEVVYQ